MQREDIYAAYEYSVQSILVYGTFIAGNGSSTLVADYDNVCVHTARKNVASVT